MNQKQRARRDHKDCYFDFCPYRIVDEIARHHGKNEVEWGGVPDGRLSSDTHEGEEQHVRHTDSDDDTGGIQLRPPVSVSG